MSKKKEFEELVEIPAHWTKARKEKFMTDFLTVAREIEAKEKVRARRAASSRSGSTGTLSPQKPSTDGVKGVAATIVPELCIVSVSEHDASSVAKAVASAILSDFDLGELDDADMLGSDIFGEDF